MTELKPPIEVQTNTGTVPPERANPSAEQLTAAIKEKLSAQEQASLLAILSTPQGVEALRKSLEPAPVVAPAAQTEAVTAPQPAPAEVPVAATVAAASEAVAVDPNRLVAQSTLDKIGRTGFDSAVAMDLATAVQKLNSGAELNPAQVQDVLNAIDKVINTNLTGWDVPETFVDLLNQLSVVETKSVELKTAKDNLSKKLVSFLKVQVDQLKQPNGAPGKGVINVHGRMVNCSDNTITISTYNKLIPLLDPYWDQAA